MLQILLILFLLGPPDYRKFGIPLELTYNVPGAVAEVGGLVVCNICGLTGPTGLSDPESARVPTGLGPTGLVGPVGLWAPVSLGIMGAREPGCGPTGLGGPEAGL